MRLNFVHVGKMDLSNDILGKCPPVPTPNPNLSRDVLGIIFAHHRENVTKAVKNAPVQTIGETVTNNVALHALRTRVSIVTCKDPGCTNYDVAVIHAVGCTCTKCRSLHIDGKCVHCDQWFCSLHRYTVDACTHKWAGHICMRCLDAVGCPRCHAKCYKLINAILHPHDTMITYQCDTIMELV